MNYIILITVFLLVLAGIFVLNEPNSIDTVIEKSKGKYFYIKRFRGYIYNYDKKIYYEGKRVCNRFEFYINGEKVHIHYYNSSTPPYVVLLARERNKRYYGYEVDDSVINFEFEKFRIKHEVGRYEVRYYEILEKGLSNEECRI